jgi:hypothetical protein
MTNHFLNLLQSLQIVIYMQMTLDQLYMPLSASDFCHNISHLENAISLVCYWIPSNFLSFNPSKAEFSNCLSASTAC